MAPLACARAEAAGFAPVGFKGFRFKEADFTLGAAFGDMELCLNVCLAISGCNLVVTEGDNLFGSVPSRCHLSTRCVHASSQQWMQGSSASASNITSALPTCGRALAAKTCRDTRKWNYLAHRSRNEETHLEYVTGSEADCKRECERSASCNGFRRDLYGRRGCQLFTGCNDPTAPAETLIKPGGGRSFTTYYMWPCVKETSIFPLPGIRRTVPPGKPTGLATFDCVGKGAVGNCVINGPRVPVTSLRWPVFYRAPASPRIRALPSDEVREQLRWFGADLHRKLPAPLATAFLAEMKAKMQGTGRARESWRGAWRENGKWPPRDDVDLYADGSDFLGRVDRSQSSKPDYFDLAAASLAARSFNGREVILVATNTQGLPISVNLVANLYELGYRHALLLATDDRVCTHLVAEEKPACAWSSILRIHHRRLRNYAVGPLQLIWLQRWYYLLRLVLGGYNAMMLDADIIITRDIYPFFKRDFANYSVLCLHDATVATSHTNGGVWYIQNAVRGGPVEGFLLDFRKRTLGVLNQSVPVIRYDASFPQKKGLGADRFLDDQWVMGNVLLSAVAGRYVSRGLHARLLAAREGSL